jgi:hypothetical protein
LRVALIGSFKQHYNGVLTAIDTFRAAGWEVTSPAGAGLSEPDIDFVRFVSDAAADSDPVVQSKTLLNIFQADLTYVVAPEGYVGRTTCYEIGRLIQARRPVYSSEPIRDLPIQLSDEFVGSPDEIVTAISQGDRPSWPFERGSGEVFDLERRLIDGN